MVGNSTFTSPQKPIQSPTSGGEPIPPPNSQNPNLLSPQITPSPSMELPQISPQPQMNPAAAPDCVSKHLIQPQQQPVQTPQQQQLQQQQGVMSPSLSFQVQPNLQRSGSLSRISQIQQQFGAALAATGLRQHNGMYNGQMSFSGLQVQQSQQSTLQMSGGLLRAGMIGQGGQHPMLPEQAAAHFNLQSQMLAQPRQKMGLIQGNQLHPANSSGQALQGMQPLGMMGSLGLNSQLRANGPLLYGQQRITPGQMRQQQLSQQTPLTSPQKPPCQNLPRTSLAAMNPQLSGSTQNGPSALVNSTLSPQQRLNQMQAAIPAPVSPHHLQQQMQQQAILPQQLSSSQLHPKSMALNQQQISQLVQQQPQLGAQQQQLQQQQLRQLLSIQQQKQRQQLSLRMPGPAVQKSVSLTGLQPDSLTSDGVMTGGSSSQGTEASNQLLGKRKIHDLVVQVDSQCRLDPEVEDFLLELADNFIESVTASVCSLAKHRKSSTLESKDVLLHLEKNWHLTIPGYTGEENMYQRNSLPSDAHMKRLELVRAVMESQQSERGTNATKQALIGSAIDHSIKPSPSSEQLVLPAAASQMLHRVVQF